MKSMICERDVIRQEPCDILY